MRPSMRPNSTYPSRSSHGRSSKLFPPSRYPSRSGHSIHTNRTYASRCSPTFHLEPSGYTETVSSGRGTEHGALRSTSRRSTVQKRSQDEERQDTSTLVRDAPLQVIPETSNHRGTFD